MNLFKKTLTSTLVFALSAITLSAVNPAFAQEITKTHHTYNTGNASEGSKPKDWNDAYIWRSYDTPIASIPTSFEKAQSVEIKEYNRAMDFNKLPFDKAIVRVRGTGERKMAVFTDVSCPFSAQLERSLNKLDDVTIYTFVIPSLQNGKYREQANRLHCLKDNSTRARAYENWFLNETWVADDELPIEDCPVDSAQVLNAFSDVIHFNSRTKSPVVYTSISPFGILDNDVVFSANTLNEIKQVMSEKTTRVKNP